MPNLRFGRDSHPPRLAGLLRCQAFILDAIRFEIGIMHSTRIFKAALFGAALAMGGISALVFPSAVLAQSEGKKQPAGDTVRPPVGTPLQAAQDLIKGKKYKEALAKINEADAVADKTPFEDFMVEQMRGIAALQGGELATAEKSFDKIFPTGRIPDASKIQLTQALAQQYYNNKNYAKSIEWTQRYYKEGGSDAIMKTLLIQAYYLNKDYTNTAKLVNEKVSAVEKSGQAPDEKDLQLLAVSYGELKNDAGYLGVLEKLVRHHPKKDYWLDLIQRTTRRPGFSADRLRLDIYRLRNAVGLVDTTEEIVDMAELALAANIPGEGLAMIEKGYALQLMGTGANVDRHKRLKDTALTQVRDDEKNLAQTEQQAVAGGNSGPLMRVAEAYAGYGKYDKAIALAEQAIAKGGLKYPDDARLRLVTYYLAANNKAKAEATAKAIKATDGSAELARLNIIYASNKGR
jgi:tetratricopeptide (TPR) repeat protein